MRLREMQSFKRKSTVRLKVAALCAYMACTNAAAYITITIDSGHTEIIDGAAGGTQASPWIVDGEIYVNGSMEVRNAGYVQSNTGYAGNGSGSVGRITVSGPGTVWEVLNNNQYGRNGGTGYLTVENGGEVINRYANIGMGPGSTGYVVVTGAGSKMTSTLNTIVGSSNDGVGYMMVQDGGAVTTANNGFLGYGSMLSTGTVLVAGQGSQWRVGQQLYIGHSGKGSLTISDGALVDVGSTATVALGTGVTGALNIGAADGDAAAAAGSITASSIVLGPGYASLVFNHTDSGYTFDTAITGTNVNGTVKVLSGQTVLTGTNTYAGQTLISGGTLQAGGLGTLSANTGYTTSGNGMLDLDGYAHTIKSLTNGGIVATGSGASATSVGTALTVNGDYIGNSGMLHLRTELGDDSSVTDQLVIRGNATGTTYVSVSNAGGLGDETDYGIKIIDVAGTSGTNAFVQSGRIVGGAYEYTLVRGDAYGGDDQSWYLTSEYITTSGGGTPGGGTPGGGVGGGVPGGGGTGVYELRPETGSYLANLSAANTMFNFKLHDRLGELQYTDLLTGQAKVSSVWIRHNYAENRFKDATGQITSKSDRNVIQMGGDIAQWSSNGQNRFHVGVMGGYGRVDAHSSSSLSGYASKAQVDGYSVGAYATWFANHEDYSGLYVDSWVIWSDLNAKVSGSGIQSQSYSIKGVSASLEAGYGFNVWSYENGYRAWLQPQAQVTWMNAKADSHYEHDTGTHVRGNHGNVQTRLGVRGYVSNAGTQSEANAMLIQPYVELNWLHNSKRYQVRMNDARVWQDGARNVGEVKLGLQANVNKTTSLWFNIGHQFGSHSYRDTGALFGARFSF